MYTCIQIVTDKSYILKFRLYQVFAVPRPVFVGDTDFGCDVIIFPLRVPTVTAVLTLLSHRNDFRFSLTNGDDVWMANFSLFVRIVICRIVIGRTVICRIVICRTIKCKIVIYLYVWRTTNMFYRGCS